MKQISKLISYLDTIPEGKDLSRRQQLTLVLWAAAVVLLPFFYFPFGVFQKLSLYPLLGIAFLNIDKWWGLCWFNKYLRYTAFAIAAFILWQIISLPFAVDIREITLADNIRPIFNEIMTYGAWYVFLASCFLLPKEKIAKTFYWSLTITLLYCCTYSVIEILHFSKIPWATDFLRKAIHYFIKDVGQSHGWWPPELWDSARLRSVFAEPSYYVVLLTFSTLYITDFVVWQAGKRYKIIWNIILLMMSILSLWGTKSASGSLSLSVSTVIFIVLFAIFFCKFDKSLKIKGLLLCAALVMFSCLAILNQRGGIGDLQLVLDKVKKSNSFSSSSGTRLIHLKTELRVIAENPVFGCGSGRYGICMKEALLKNPEKTRESRLWSENEEYVPPRLNRYTAIAVEFGVLGLLCFLTIFFPVLFSCIEKLTLISPEKWLPSIVCCTSIAVLLVSANSHILPFLLFLTYPIFCLTNINTKK